MIDTRKIDFKSNFYSGNDLGVICEEKKTKIRIWSPTATKVEFNLYSNQLCNFPFQSYKLKEGKNGTWKKNIEKDYSGFYYLFGIYYGDDYKETIDPYARAVGTNSKKGLIVDLKKTNPQGWKNDERKKIDNPSEAIIYELHVRDFSSSSTSAIKNRGTYLAFTEKATVNKDNLKTGIAHLKELGITHVHLLPVFDFGSVDDKKNDYNWGYDPFLYNVPEGSYATNPSDESRIIEFKKMIKSLHDNKIGVILDVVYNHTYCYRDSVFQKIAPNYFYRFVGDNFANGSGCGNEIATERPMVRKFMVDSVAYWATEYHIDGFRFDLMGLMDKKTMKEVEKRLHQIDSSILIYGEPWSALDPQLDWEKQMKKGSQKGEKIAVFNDDFKEAIKGSLLRREDKRYELLKGIVGSIEYNNSIKGFAYKPDETINYVSCHDNLTLWDEIKVSFPNFSEKEKIRMHRLAHALILTSQGIPFLQGGMEFLRTKYCNGNSYNAGDDCNKLKWKRKKIYHDTFNYYKGLIELRKKHPAFRMTSPNQIKKNLHFIESRYEGLGFKLLNFANGDTWEEIYVFYNFKRNWIQFNLPKEKEFKIVVDKKKAGVKTINEFKADNVKVPPISAMVLRKA